MRKLIPKTAQRFQIHEMTKSCRHRSSLGTIHPELGVSQRGELLGEEKRKSKLPKKLNALIIECASVRPPTTTTPSGSGYDLCGWGRVQTYSDCRIVSHKINAARFRQSPQPKKRDFEAAATKKFVPQQIFHNDLWACAEKKTCWQCVSSHGIF